MSGDPHAGLVPGRKCGTCTVCCKEPTIESDSFRKVQGVLCEHCTPGEGCSIYHRRPQVCREFYCQWRRYAWLNESWRPDRSQMMLRATDDDVPEGYASSIGVVFDVLGPCEVLLRQATLNVIGTLIDRNVATFLSAPGLPGWSTGRVLLNPSLEAVVRDRDGNRMRARLVDAFLLSALHPKGQPGVD
jgi:hypothetical protein